MHDRDFPAAVGNCVFERVFGDPPRARTRNDARSLGDRVRVVIDRDKMLDTDIQALGVLPDQHDIDILETPAGHISARRSHVGIQLEQLAQLDADRAETLPDRGGQRAFQRQPGLADAVQRRLRQGCAQSVERGHSRLLLVPVEGRIQRIQDRNGGRRNLGPDAIAANQRGRNFFVGRHISNFVRSAEIWPGVILAACRSLLDKIRSWLLVAAAADIRLDC